jgi:hypothetical protein
MDCSTHVNVWVWLRVRVRVCVSMRVCYFVLYLDACVVAASANLLRVIARSARDAHAPAVRDRCRRVFAPRACRARVNANHSAVF